MAIKSELGVQAGKRQVKTCSHKICLLLSLNHTKLIRFKQLYTKIFTLFEAIRHKQFSLFLPICTFNSILVKEIISEY